MGVRKRVIASLPGVRWRDARIAKIESDLEAERVKLNQANERLKITEGQLQDAKAKVDEAQNLAERVEKRRKRDATEAFRRRSTVSFKAQLVSYKAAYDASPGVTDPLYSTKCQVPYKLRNYSFAESHGFNAPQVYRVWESASSVDLSQVQADQMVLKADSGHSGKAVWPLIREGEVWRSLDGKLSIPNAPLPAEMCAELAEMRGPFFAEELLKSLGGAPVPEDVKLYMAYGEVMHVLVMEPPADGSLDRRAFQRRYFAEDGMDLGRLVSGAEYGDINPPAGLSELVKAAKVLSVASGLPFIRVDLYQTVGGPVLGELTLVPGGRQAYSRQHDEHLGSMWAGAQARLDRDLLMGRPPGMLFGSEDFAWHYPGDSVGGGPNDWPIMRARKKHESRPTLV